MESESDSYEGSKAKNGEEKEQGVVVADGCEEKLGICKESPHLLTDNNSSHRRIVQYKSWLRILKLSSRGCIEEFSWTMSILKIKLSWFVLHLSNMTASLVLASDGLWDEVSNQEAIDIVSAICMPDKKPTPLAD